MSKKRLWIFLVLVMTSLPGRSQTSQTLPRQQQAVLLELAGSAWYVVKYASIDLDSAIITASRSLGISLLPLMTEAIPEEVAPAHSSWVSTGSPWLGKQQLPGLKGVSHIQQLYLLGAWYAFQSTAHTALMDSAVSYLSRARTEAEQAGAGIWARRAAGMMGKAYLGRNDTVTGNKWFRLAVEECRRADDIAGEELAWKNWAVYYVYLPSATQERIEHLKKADELYKKQQNSYPRINTLMHLGYLLFSKGDYRVSEQTFEAAVHLQDSLRWAYTHYTTDVLAMHARIANHYDNMLRYALRSVKSAEQTKDSLNWTIFYLRMSDVFNAHDLFRNEFLYWCGKALDRLMVSGDGLMVYEFAQSEVMELVSSGQRDKASALIEKIQQKFRPANLIDSGNYHQLLFRYAAAIHDTATELKYAKLAAAEDRQMEKIRPYLQGYGDWLMGAALFDCGAYQQAEPFFRTYLVSLAAQQQPGPTLAAYKSLVCIDTLAGNMAAAAKDYHQYFLMDSSAFSAEQARQVEILKVQYETEERTKDIQLLQAQTGLQERQLQHADLIRAIAIGGIVLLLIISGLLYNRYRLKQRSNWLLQLQKGEIEQQNTQLKKLVSEKESLLEAKEWLMKELHHRVKNNLQIMMSLQKLQARNLTNEEAFNAIAASNSRLHAMALIHQKLYKPTDLGWINMDLYISELVIHLRDALRTEQAPVVETELAHIELEVSQAISVGLILNEAVTNAFKYAFKDMSPASAAHTPRIYIAMQPTGKYEIELVIKDNGKGYVKEENGKRSSLGFSLIETLAEQLDAKLIMLNDSGLTIRMRFPATYKVAAERAMAGFSD